MVAGLVSRKITGGRFVYVSAVANLAIICGLSFLYVPVVVCFCVKKQMCQYNLLVFVVIEHQQCVRTTRREILSQHTSQRDVRSLARSNDRTIPHSLARSLALSPRR